VAVALTSSIGRNKRRNHSRSTGSRASNGGGAKTRAPLLFLQLESFPTLLSNSQQFLQIDL